MIEYLEKLIADKHYAKALDFAEQLLRNPGNSATDLLTIHCAILLARLTFNEYSGAIVAGEVALKLAEELQQWDRFGVTCYDLGFAYYHLSQSSEAMNFWYRYLSKLTLYLDARKFEASVRFNIAFGYAAEGNFGFASSQYMKALEAAEGLKDERLAHGIRQALVGTLLKSGEFTPIPRLLVVCQKYLRNNLNAPELNGSRLWQLRLRVDYAMLTDRPSKARTLAVRGLEESAGKPTYEFMFHMALARIAQRFSVNEEALGHGISARIYASLVQRYDLEAEAADFIYELTQGDPVALLDWEQYYLSDALIPLDGGCHR